MRYAPAIAAVVLTACGAPEDPPQRGTLLPGLGAYVTDTMCYPFLWEFEGEHEKPPPGLERPTFERRGDTVHPPIRSR